MTNPNFPNKPLVEAIFELRWDLPAINNTHIDKHYKLRLGRFYDRFVDNFPHHEPLPSSHLPDELTPYAVQHRFRVGENQWPLIQLGPGILTANDTQEYKWETFSSICLSASRHLLDSQPRSSPLKFTNLVLRYVDSIEFDFVSASILRFLSDFMKVNLALPDRILSESKTDYPTSLSINLAFELSALHSSGQITFSTGIRNDSPALVWETIITSAPEATPQDVQGIDAWLQAAHNASYKWFDALTEGELQRRFLGA